MPKPVTVTIPHELGKAEAKRRLAESFGSIRQQLAGGSIALAKVDETWEGDRMRFELQSLDNLQAARDLLLSNAEDQAKEVGRRPAAPSVPIVAEPEPTGRV